MFNSIAGLFGLSNPTFGPHLPIGPTAPTAAAAPTAVATVAPVPVLPVFPALQQIPVINNDRHDLERPDATLMKDKDQAVGVLDHYYTANGYVLQNGSLLLAARQQPTFLPVDELVESPLRLGCLGIRRGEEDLPIGVAYQATFNFVYYTIIQGPGPVGYTYNNAMVDVIHYLMFALSTTISEIDRRTPLMTKAYWRLRSQKIGIAAYVIYAMVMGFDCFFPDKAQGLCTLRHFKTLDKMIYYCYILPLVLLVSLKMDNEKHRCLYVDEILDQNIDSFTRTGAKSKLTGMGVWSYDRLKEISARPILRNGITDGELTGGIEINIARVLVLLVAPGKMHFPDEHKWHVTEAEKDLLRGREAGIPPFLINRALEYGTRG